ncbi:hypothetical protein BDN70DRAFT_933364 [Pholiota conissans]|uniref:Uncharacterized protein n=1 Tax=Pholiota conissans TaxID=109636 RepID=A0A9P6D0B8_9AGAR|nr:hypothetical protein BDN70DRAFT_933364 [Pholiota conissans]
MAAASGGSSAMLAGPMIITNGTFHQVNYSDKDDSQEVLRTLSAWIKSELFHDSKKHDTLRQISKTPGFHIAESDVDDIIAWSTSRNHDDNPDRQNILRRHYSARAFAFSLSQELEIRGELLTSIILPPHDPVDMYQIIAIIVYQLARNIPTFCQHVRNALRDDPKILDRTAELQVERLIVEPLLETASADPLFRRPLALIVVVAGVHSQVVGNSASASVFDMIDTISRKRGLYPPISPVLVSCNPNRSHTLILIISLSFDSHPGT